MSTGLACVCVQYCQTAMPCSWPPGMRCQVSRTRALRVLKWQCFEEDAAATNALPDDGGLGVGFPLQKRARRSNANGEQGNTTGVDTAPGQGRRGQLGLRRQFGPGARYGQRRFAQGQGQGALAQSFAQGARRFPLRQRMRQSGPGLAQGGSQGMRPGGGQQNGARSRAAYRGHRRPGANAPLARAPGVSQASRLGAIQATQQQQQPQRQRQQVGPGTGPAADMQADDTQVYKPPASDSSESQALSSNGITCRWLLRELPITEKCSCMCFNEARP